MEHERWTDADDASASFAAIPDEHPVKLTRLVSHALISLTEPESLPFLERIVTPESRDAWGDFSAAAAMVTAGQYGVNGTPRSWPSSPDVADVFLMAGTEARMITRPELVEVPVIFTWVWRPELGGWRLHGIGASIPPELVPRTSPGRAPDIGAIAPHIPG